MVNKDEQVDSADPDGRRSGRFDHEATAPTAGTRSADRRERALFHRAASLSSDDRDAFAFDPAADPDGTFPQSIASGSPTTSGVVLWTRVAPDAFRPGQPLAVEVARDASFETVVFDGTVETDEITPARDYTVAVDLDGLLESNRFYHYRFVYDGVASRVGRCRTLPASDDDLASISFAVLTCQDYQNGYYGTYGHVAAEDVDYVVHLGDFIYESAEGQYLSPTDDVVDGREIELPSGAPLAESVADFRHLHALYRSDPLLQRGLEAHTLIAGWDDHEVGDNWWWDDETDSPRLPEKERGDDPSFATDVAANGIRAWAEYVPARVTYDPDREHLHDRFRLYRSLEFGDLVTMAVTDERLYRDGPPGTESTETGAGDGPDRTMLGADQRSWFLETVADSNARWTVWANEVLTMPLTVTSGYNQLSFLHDSWDGYGDERELLMAAIADADPRNFVTLTGDMHCSVVGYQQTRYNDWWWVDAEPVGVEFMTPAVTSVNAADVVDFPGTWDDEALGWLVRANNPHMEFVNWHEHGYAVVEFTPEECTYTVYSVDKTVDAADADRSVLASYRVPDGDVSLQRVTVDEPADAPEAVGSAGTATTTADGSDPDDRDRPESVDD